MQQNDEIKQTIPEFYAGKNVFLTGGTGFIGKVVIEKLLRSCPNVKGIYCLVRPKRGKTTEERMKAMLQDKVYDKIRRVDADFAKKVHIIPGDVMEDNLGISPEDSAFLENNIDIVFHSAATVRFEEPMRLAIRMNVIATKKMIQLCKRMKNLISLVHVSTAYANCDRQFIEEVIYPSLHKPENIIDMIQWMDEETLNSITPKLIGPKPNTYTYTKQLAEYMLVQEASNLPIAILRPSIVTASWKEPFPGWIDNLNGPSGLYIAYGKGLMRTMIMERDLVADMIPVDISVNMLLAVGWYTAVYNPNKILLYHCTSGTLNPCTWGASCSHVKEVFKKVPLEGGFRRPRCFLTNKPTLYDYWIFVSHHIPAYLVDGACRLIGKKPRMVSLYARLHKAMSTLTYFTTRSWEWSHTGLDMLKAVMTAEDSQNFYLDPRSIHWPTYFEDFCLGTKKFILKEEISNVDTARAHIRKLRNIRYCFNTLALVLLWRLLIANSNLARSSWYFVLNLALKFLRFFRLSSTMT